MITKTNVTIYKCEFCKKKMFRRHAMQSHEERCFHNPANKRPCFECGHLEMKEQTVFGEHRYDGGNYEKQVKMFFCNKLNHCLISPQTAIKGNAVYSDDIESYENKDMPIVCDQWIDNLPF